MFPMLQRPESIAHPILWLNSLCLTVLVASRCSIEVEGGGGLTLAHPRWWFCLGRTMRISFGVSLGARTEEGAIGV